MGLSFSKKDDRRKKRTKDEVHDSYVDKRLSYKRPKHKMSNVMLNLLASEHVASFSTKNQVLTLALVCENAYKNISQMDSYWYHSSVLVGMGNWNWFFSNKKNKIRGKSWMQVHSFLMYEKVRYVSNDLKKAFPETLNFGTKETWNKCKLNRYALDCAFSDLVHLFPAFNEGRGDNQCDIYPIGVEAYIRIREPAKGSREDIVSEKRGKDLLQDIQCLTAHLEDWLYDPLAYATWEVEETYETLTGRSPSLSKYINNPHVNVVSFRGDSRDDVLRSCRILFSQMFSHVLQVHIPSILKDPLMALRVLHTAIENAYSLVEDAEYIPDVMNGIRPNDIEDWDILYTSDLVKPFQDALNRVVPKLKEAVKANMFPLFPSDCRRWNVKHHMDCVYPRLERCSTTYLNRVRQSLIKSGDDDDNDNDEETKFLFLSDSDRMPGGPSDNDHNGIVYLALLTRKFAWVVMGKSDSC